MAGLLWCWTEPLACNRFGADVSVKIIGCAVTLYALEPRIFRILHCYVKAVMYLAVTSTQVAQKIYKLRAKHHFNSYIITTLSPDNPNQCPIYLFRVPIFLSESNVWIRRYIITIIIINIIIVIIENRLKRGPQCNKGRADTSFFKSMRYEYDQFPDIWHFM